jgi:signal transduction histidine kinase
VAACILALVLVPLFGAVDYLMYPSHFGTLMTVRGVSAAAAALLLYLLTRTRGGRHHPAWIGAALVVQAEVAIAAFPVYLTGIETPNYVSSALLLLTAAALLPWTPQQVGYLTAAVSLMYVAGGLSHDGPLNAVTFGAQVSAINASGVLAVVISLLAERTRTREFSARAELKVAGREQKRLIQHLGEMAARLATANEDLHERQRETNDFLYVLSHDLRAPLINIQGFGRRLDTDMVGLKAALAESEGTEAARRVERMQQSLQFLHAGTAKIDQLISRLLEIARLTTRPGRQGWIDTNRMVRDVIAACAYQLQGGGIEVTVGALPSVWADAVQLNQVFANLVDNSIKYMGSGPQRRIAVTCDVQGNRYRFAVRDTGCGIAARDQEKVFRLFARAVTNGNTAGEGVGLAAVRAIVNRHGGRIWVESAPGEGSTFYFTVPRAPAEEESIMSHLHSATPMTRGEERNVHVQ